MKNANYEMLFVHLGPGELFLMFGLMFNPLG